MTAYAGMFVYERDARGQDRPYSIGAGSPEDMGTLAKLHEKRNEEAKRAGRSTPRRVEIVYGFSTQEEALTAMRDRYYSESDAYASRHNVRRLG